MPKSQSIKRDVLQIYISRTYVWLWIREITNKLLCDDNPFQAPSEGAGVPCEQASLATCRDMPGVCEQEWDMTVGGHSQEWA